LWRPAPIAALAWLHDSFMAVAASSSTDAAATSWGVAALSNDRDPEAPAEAPPSRGSRTRRGVVDPAPPPAPPP
jgi:hypothetical protein